MANRWGRNQKRKSCEEIAKLKSVVQHQHREIADQLNLRRQLEDQVRRWARSIVETLGEDSAFAKNIAQRVVEPYTIRSLKQGQPLKLTPSRPSIIHAIDRAPVKTSYEVIEAFCIWAETHDDLRDLRRFILTSPHGESVYMADINTLRADITNQKNELVQFIAEQLLLAQRNNLP